MSGSGPSVFGLFDDEETAHAARASLAGDARAARGCFYVTDLQPKDQAALRRRAVERGAAEQAERTAASPQAAARASSHRRSCAWNHHQ